MIMFEKKEPAGPGEREKRKKEWVKRGREREQHKDRLRMVGKEAASSGGKAFRWTDWAEQLTLGSSRGRLPLGRTNTQTASCV
jgi:hypothetical protein